LRQELSYPLEQNLNQGTGHETSSQFSNVHHDNKIDPLNNRIVMRKNAGHPRVTDAEQKTASEQINVAIAAVGGNVNAGFITAAQLDAMTAQASVVPLPEEEDGDVLVREVNIVG
jgi:ATP-dependent protease ClpP protease subunit